MRTLLGIAAVFWLVPVLTFAQPAWINTTDDVFVRSTDRGPSVALLRYGDQVQIQRQDGPWSFLIPVGRVPTRILSTGQRPEVGSFLGDPHRFRYGRIRRANVRSSTGERFDKNDEIIIRPTGNSNYWSRPAGGLIPASAVRELTPSTFTGWISPADTFAFVIRTVEPFTRYERYALRSYSAQEAVTVNGIVIPRTLVRVGYKHARPATIPANAQWVHVDLDQQILTAYEGDRLVFATLVSTGKSRTPTHTGLHRVRRKIIHTRMVGGGRNRYSVEGVPWTMYLGDDDGPSAQAFHGAYWHDSFGRVMSHGCINLSLIDAEHLFRWARPELPVGWRSIHPEVFQPGSALWALIE